MDGWDKPGHDEKATHSQLRQGELQNAGCFFNQALRCERKRASKDGSVEKSRRPVFPIPGVDDHHGSCIKKIETKIATTATRMANSSLASFTIRLPRGIDNPVGAAAHFYGVL